jgi:Tfp pilus assembly protein PilZ
MNRENERRYERVETNVKVKLPGDTTWIECTTSNISGGGLFFEAARRLSIGDFVALQFMLQSKSGTISNVHFFASARVVRVIPKAAIYKIAVEFILDDYVRKEILQLIEMIKSQSLRLDRPSINDTLFPK